MSKRHSEQFKQEAVACALWCFRAEMILRDSVRIAGLTRPTIWIGIACCGIHLGPRIQQRLIEQHVPLRRRHKANRAVPMFMVVPVH
jgi:hypothetical protein